MAFGAALSLATVYAALTGPESDSAGSAPSGTGNELGTVSQIGPHVVSECGGRLAPAASDGPAVAPGVGDAIAAAVGADVSAPVGEQAPRSNAARTLSASPTIVDR